MQIAFSSIAGTSSAPLRYRGNTRQSTPLIWMRPPYTFGIVGLAITRCAELNGDVESLEKIEELLVAAGDLGAEVPSLDEAGKFASGRLTHRLIHMADIEAVTA